MVIVNVLAIGFPPIDKNPCLPCIIVAGRLQEWSDKNHWILKMKSAENCRADFGNLISQAEKIRSSIILAAEKKVDHQRIKKIHS